MNIKSLLERSVPGAKSTLNAHLKRATQLAQAIHAHYPCKTPYQWQAKHLRWYLETQTSSLANATRYDYWRTCRAVADALGKWPDWEPHLRGDWNHHPTRGLGGRPPKLTNRQKRN
jgi:hypothetical protein